MFQAFGRRGKQPIEPDEISMVHGLVKDYGGKRALETECREALEAGNGRPISTDCARCSARTARIAPSVAEDGLQVQRARSLLRAGPLQPTGWRTTSFG